MNSKSTDLEQHLQRLHRLGLYAIPGWGGGKLLPGATVRGLALSPPSLDDMLHADYSGGLIILAGTENPFGGYVVAIDVDRGPEAWPQMPKGFLYDELGTRSTKHHIFVRTTDRLEGVLNLVAYDSRDLVCEIKGLNLSLRSWPTQPPDKPRGYTPMSWPLDPINDPPALTARQLAEGLADFLSGSLGEAVWVKDNTRSQVNGAARTVPSTELARTVEEELERRDVRLGREMSSGWRPGFCPFHANTRTKAFSVNLSAGWRCHGACNTGGSIFDLARRLGIAVRIDSQPGRRRQRKQPSNHHEPISVTNWEVRF